MNRKLMLSDFDVIAYIPKRVCITLEKELSIEFKQDMLNILKELVKKEYTEYKDRGYTAVQFYQPEKNKEIFLIWEVEYNHIDVTIRDKPLLQDEEQYKWTNFLQIKKDSEHRGKINIQIFNL